MVLERSWQKRNRKYRMNRKINSVPTNRIKIGVQDRRTIIEELKMQEQMAWGRMNNIRACAEERVVKEIVYA